MNYSKDGQALTEQFESCHLTAYQDIKGIWTIGWGHTGKDVTPGLTISQAQADTFLSLDMYKAVNTVNYGVHIPVTQGEFDALVDFAFNCGCSAFLGSTMLVLINENNLAAAAEEFAKWDHASGVIVAGLLRRRLAEKAEFNS
jgi:lysozyme